MSSEARILIKTEVGAESETLKKVKEKDGVVYAEPLYGVYDIIAKVNADNNDKLRKRVIGKDGIRSINEVRETLSCIVVTDENGPIGFTKDENGNIKYCHPSLK